MAKFFLSCDEATAICDKSQYNKASFYELLQLRLHLWTCCFCRLYSRQNKLLTKALKHKKSVVSFCGLTDKEKEALQNELKSIQNKES
ncbi:MAG: hypothetical protein ACPHXR_00550 [Flavicella sp.]